MINSIKFLFQKNILTEYLAGYPPSRGSIIAAPSPSVYLNPVLGPRIPGEYILNNGYFNEEWGLHAVPLRTFGFKYSQPFLLPETGFMERWILEETLVFSCSLTSTGIIDHSCHKEYDEVWKNMDIGNSTSKIEYK